MKEVPRPESLRTAGVDHSKGVERKERMARST